MKISGELGAEIEKQRVAFKWVSIDKENTPQLPA
jgi:hypothetical protein